MSDVVLWGASGQAKVLRECLEHHQHQLVALFDNDQQITAPFADVPLYHGMDGFVQWQSSINSGDYYFLVAIGGDRGLDRCQIQDQLIAKNLRPLTVIHPSAAVAKNTTIATGCQILANATVCVEVSLGRETIINTAASVDHECRIGEGVHLCPGSHLAGCVEVGDYAMIGTGAIVLPHIKIGRGAIVGAGSVVIHDVPDNTVVVGNPAKFLKMAKKNE